MLAISLSASTFGKEKTIDQLFPDLKDEGRRLMSGYVQSLDFAYCMASPSEALEKRRLWNRYGQRYTTYLLRKIRNRPEEEASRIIILLAGTHDDQAAVALCEILKHETEGKMRSSTYAALAELGYYTDYHSRLLLAEVIRGRREKTGNRAWDSAAALATIHNPEAVWAQDQLYRQHLVDGGLSEMVGPLLKFRDLALRR